jgi:SH3-like domain-containing protein
LSLKILLTESFGVVVSDSTKIYSGIGKDNVVLFILHEGAEFEINQSHEGWISIELTDGKKGWIRKKNIRM